MNYSHNCPFRTTTHTHSFTHLPILTNACHYKFTHPQITTLTYSGQPTHQWHTYPHPSIHTPTNSHTSPLRRIIHTTTLFALLPTPTHLHTWQFSQMPATPTHTHAFTHAAACHTYPHQCIHSPTKPPVTPTHTHAFTHPQI